MACENNYYVYKHSTPNNKIYIGITKWIDKHLNRECRT